MNSALKLFLIATIFASPSFGDTFTYTGSEQQYTVTQSGLYQITAYGAQGGTIGVGNGGAGAILGGDFTLTAGEILDLYVGQTGAGGASFSGGGGATWVSIDSPQSLLIAAGGGGGGGYFNVGGDATITHSGSSGGAGGASVDNTGGAGGGGGYSGKGGDGGSGFFVNGCGGGGFPSLAGGCGGQGGASGGYGGGGGGAFFAAGGGGGYNGGIGADGSSSQGGGGGGSYIDAGATNLIELSGAQGNMADGQVTITPATAAVTPEPASLVLLMTGVIPLAALYTRSKHFLAS